MKLIAIAAVSIDGIIGIDGQIPWHIPEDLKHYKNQTTGKTVIIGYNTYLTLPEKAFKNRMYVVLNKNQSYDVIIEKINELYHIIDFNYLDKLKKFKKDEVVYIAGGEMIYNSLLEKCDEAVITWINKSYPNGNKKFPIKKLYNNFEEELGIDWERSSSGLYYKIIYYKKI